MDSECSLAFYSPSEVETSVGRNFRSNMKRCNPFEVGGGGIDL